MLFSVQSFKVKDLPEETAYLFGKTKGCPPVKTGSIQIESTASAVFLALNRK